jgi:cell division transport system permease protein
MGIIKSFVEGWILFKKRKLISFVLVFISFLLSSFILSGVFIYYLSNEIVSYLRSRLDFSIYFKEETNREDINKLKNILEGFNGVKEVIFITKESAFEEFQKKYIANPSIVKSLIELNINPLIDYLIVRADDVKIYSDIASYLETSPYRVLIDFTTYSENKRVIDRFASVSNYLNLVILIFSVVILLFTFLIVFNLTLLSIFSQKDEIEVLRLIGTPNYFIRLPFIVFNLISSILGFIIAQIFFVFFIFKTSDFWKQLLITLQPINFYLNNFWLINLAILGFLLITNIIASTLAIQRYLKI